MTGVVVGEHDAHAAAEGMAHHQHRLLDPQGVEEVGHPRRVSRHRPGARRRRRRAAEAGQGGSEHPDTGGGQTCQPAPVDAVVEPQPWRNTTGMPLPASP